MSLRAGNVWCVVCGMGCVEWREVGVGSVGLMKLIGLLK